MSQYFVSRQQSYYEDLRVVEVAKGGIDNASPDMLSDSSKYGNLGSGQLYQDPREAAEAAIKIARTWHAELRSTWNCRKEGRRCPAVRTSAGDTAGGMFILQPCTYAELRVWAEKEWESLPKCRWCDRPLGKKSYAHDLEPEYVFCSERCANEDLLDQIKQDVIARVQEQVAEDLCFQGEGMWICHLYEDYHIATFTPTSHSRTVSVQVDPVTYQIRPEHPETDQDEDEES